MTVLSDFSRTTFFAFRECRQRILLTPRGAIQAMRCGTHSGFRRCCIRYWINTWAGTSGSRETAHIYAWLKHEDDIGAVHGYVPCPECIAQKRMPVQVRRCPGPRGPGTRCYGYTGIHWTLVQD